MKSFGTVRLIDELGRVVIPKQIRRSMNLEPGGCLEIFMEAGQMVARRYNPNQTAEMALMEFKDIVQNDTSLTCKEAVLQAIEDLEARLSEEQEPCETAPASVGAMNQI